MALFTEFVIVFLAFVIILTFRNFFKSLVSYLYGDETAYSTGYITTNPFNQIDILGLLPILLLVFMIGGYLNFFGQRLLLWILMFSLGVRWVYPVPVNEHRFWHGRIGMISTMLAGPLSCFILAWLFMYCRSYLPLHLLPRGVELTFFQLINAIVEYAIFFGVMDCIPLPPFDFGYILLLLIPEGRQRIIFFIDEYGVYILFTLFVVPGISNIFFGFVFYLSHYVERFLSLLVL